MDEAQVIASDDQRSAPRLICYALHDFAPRLVPAAVPRKWMDNFPGQQAYNCLPMTIANAFGWDLLCPVPLESLAWENTVSRC